MIDDPNIVHCTIDSLFMRGYIYTAIVSPKFTPMINDFCGRDPKIMSNYGYNMVMVVHNMYSVINE